MRKSILALALVRFCTGNGTNSRLPVALNSETSPLNFPILQLGSRPPALIDYRKLTGFLYGLRSSPKGMDIDGSRMSREGNILGIRRIDACKTLY